MSTIITHDDTFHLDDVCAVAIIELYEGDECIIIRTRDPLLIEQGDYVVDVGKVYNPLKKRFDHHQIEGAGVREDLFNLPYASCGLVWKEYGLSLCHENEEVWKSIDSNFFAPIDAGDNGIDTHLSQYEGVGYASLHSLLKAYLPSWKEPNNSYILDSSFREVVNHMKFIIQRMIKHYFDTYEAREEVKKVYESTKDKRIIILEKPHQPIDILTDYKEPLFVIYPKDNERKIWKVKAVRKTKDSFESRMLLPESYRGLNEESLQKISGVSDALFVHRNGFVGSAYSKEGAIKLLPPL